MARTTAKIEARFRIGERVRLRDVYQSTDAVIVEDRGLLAPGGRRVYRVRVLIPEGEGDQPDFEVPVDDLLRLSTAA